MFCCEPFQRRVENAGRRGLSFLITKFENKYYFSAQARGVDVADESSIKHLAATVNLASELAIKFCPFCGTSLSSIADAAPKKFERIAETHKNISLAASVIK